MLHEHGSNNPLGISSNTDRIYFHPYYTFKDLVGVFLFLLVLSYIVFYHPNALAHPDNYIMANPMSTPKSIVPEWSKRKGLTFYQFKVNKLLYTETLFNR